MSLSWWRTTYGRRSMGHLADSLTGHARDACVKGDLLQEPRNVHDHAGRSVRHRVGVPVHSLGLTPPAQPEAASWPAPRCRRRQGEGGGSTDLPPLPSHLLQGLAQLTEFIEIVDGPLKEAGWDGEQARDILAELNKM